MLDRRRRKQLTVAAKDIEQLESRWLLSADWQNPVHPLNVDGDIAAIVSPLDALIAINELTNRAVSDPETGLLDPRDIDDDDSPYFDVDGDGYISPIDPLRVINWLDRFYSPLAEGESWITEKELFVQLGQDEGSRRISFELDVEFDTTDTGVLVGDALNVYLLNADGSGATLLDRGVQGEAIFSLTEKGPDLVPGLVAYDGMTLTVDVTSLADESGGLLVFQLVNGDTDEGTTARFSRLANVVETEGTAGPVFPDNSSVIAPSDEVDLATYDAVSDIVASIRNLSVDSATGEYEAEIGLRNNGTIPLSRGLAVRLPNLPPGVAVLNASGVDDTGVPYLNLDSAVFSGGLDVGATTMDVALEIANPNHTRFELVAEVFSAGPNRPPEIALVANQTLMPGSPLTIELNASDPDGDAITYAIAGGGNLSSVRLTGNQLTMTASPSDIGATEIVYRASDGVLQLESSFVVEVVADPITTTRLSGQVMDSDGSTPLVGVPVELNGVTEVTDASGEFTLEVTSLVADDTLKIRGEEAAIPGVTYPFVAEKVHLLLDNGPFGSVNNVISRPIYLPAVDVSGGSPIDPASDTLVNQEIAPGETASVFVEAGTLLMDDGMGGMVPFDGVLSITEVPAEFTPAALPATLFPDTVVTIQPAEMVFTDPAELSLPNRAGYNVGQELRLWSINPDTGQFDDVGVGIVSSDGQLIETVSGGILNSSWHFFAPDPDTFDPDDLDENEDDRCRKCKATRSVGSSVELHSGHYQEWHDLVSYQSYGATRSFRLHYNSRIANPKPIVHFSMVSPSSRPDGRLGAALQFNGNGLQIDVPGSDLTTADGRELHFWSLPAAGTATTLALQGDLTSVPTGRYAYDVVYGNFVYDATNTALAGATDQYAGDVIHVNAVHSPFGAGWGLVGLQRLVENEDQSILIVDGDGETLLFEPPLMAGGPFVAPPGDYSELMKNSDGTFTRTTTNKSVFEFDPTGRIESSIDRNGNSFDYTYMDGQLATITDPAGLETRFLYDSNGNVREIIDPAGRSTRLEVDNDGDLLSIVDPDASSRSFSYTASHLLVSELDQNGHLESIEYNNFGRVVEVTRPDGTSTVVDALQSQVVMPAGMTSSVLSPPVARSSSDALGRIVSANGVVAESSLDQGGQEKTTTDSLGGLGALDRNVQNLVTLRTDGRGFEVSFGYDDLGNLTSILTDGLGDVEESISVTDSLREAVDGHRFLKVGDLNGDGLDDIVTAGNNDDWQVAIYFGNGDDSFQAPKTISLSGWVTQLRLEDLNDDGDLDIVATTNASLAIVAGTGTGVFDAPVEFTVDEFAVGPLLFVSDIDADGSKDIVVHRRTNELTILQGDGEGSFSFGQPVTLDAMPTVGNIQIGDVNADGLVDVAAQVGSDLMLFPGESGSTLWTGELIATNQPISGIEFEDIDQDLDTDIVVFGLDAGESEAASYLNNGDGTFADRVVSSLSSFGPTNVFHYTYGDVNADGTNDVVVNDLSAGVAIAALGSVDGQFQPSSLIPSGIDVAGLGLGDFGGDGSIDLVGVSYTVGTSFSQSDIRLFAGNGNGSFETGGHTILAAGDQPTDVAVGDINADGFLDIVTANNGSGDISVLIADGDSGFEPQQTYFVFGPESIVLEDVNNDSILDVIVTSSGRHRVEVLVGSTDLSGNFLGYFYQPSVPVGSNPYDVVVADITGDGNADIVTTNISSDDISIAAGRGDGTFLDEVRMPVGDSPNQLDVGDLDGDLDLDIVVANRSSNDLSILFNDNAGFSHVPIMTADNPKSVLATDFNEDGNVDLLIGHVGSGGLSLFAGDGLGGFSEAWTRDFHFGASDLAVGDVNRDGIKDILATRQNLKASGNVFLGTGGGSIEDIDLRVAQRLSAVELGDIDGDGILDAIGTDSVVDGVAIVRGSGSGSFGDSATYATVGGAPVTMKLADFNGDGSLDTATATSDGLDIRLSHERNIQQDGFRYIPESSVRDISVGDLNHDSIPDILYTASNFFGTLLGVGDGTFVEGARISGIAAAVQLDDFDGDGGLDGAFLNGNTVTIRRGTGNGLLPAVTAQVDLGVFGGEDFGSADFNSDGYLDIVALGSFGAGRAVSISLGSVDGTFGAASTYDVAFSQSDRRMSLADVDGDSIIDVIVGASPGVSVLRGLGDGTLNQEEFFGVSSTSGMAVGDINSDGRVDVVGMGRGEFRLGLGGSRGQLAVLLGTVDGFSEERIVQFDGISNPLGGVVGDTDQDGNNELLLFGTSYQSNVAEPPGSVTVLEAISFVFGQRDVEEVFAYDPDFSQLTARRDELRRETLYDVDPATGNRLVERVVVGNVDSSMNGETDDVVTQYSYTSNGLVQSVVDALGRTTQYTYDFDLGEAPRGLLRQTTFAAGTPDEAARWFEYDDAGNQTAVIDENGNQTEYAYDILNNRLMEIIEPDPDGDGPLESPVTRFTYDARGNLKTTTDARGNTTENFYDELDRVIRTRDANENDTFFTYDPNGNLQTVTDQLEHTTTNFYDARNRLIETVDPDGGRTQFRYDADNNLIQLTDPVGNRTRFAYDARDRLVREVDAIGAETLYKYDAVDNLIEKIDRNGRVTRYEYDDLDRLGIETWIDVAGATVNVIDFTYDKAGNLLTAVDDNESSLTFTYDNRDRVGTVVNGGTVGAPEVLLEYSYDGMGNVLSVTDDADGQTTTSYDYDALNRAKTISQSGAATSDKLVDFIYNELGQFDEISRYSDLSRVNLVAISDYNYDSLNRLESLEHGSSTDPRSIAFYDYEFDDASRITRITDVDGVTDYSYDDRSQLTGADRDVGDPRGDELYGYDGNGNRTESHLHGNAYQIGDGNRLLSDGTYIYTYDDEGNLIRRAATTSGEYRQLVYDHRNRLASVTDYSLGGVIIQSVEYDYDPLDRRIAKTVDADGDGGNVASTLFFVHDREDVILDFDSSAGALDLNLRYLHGPGFDRILCQESDVNDNAWLLRDHLGTTRQLVNGMGSATSQVAFDSYGNVVAIAGEANPSRYLFNGREFDEETGMYYFRSRYFAPGVGRFISEDSLGFGGGDVNLHRFVKNNPLSFVDPTGNQTIDDAANFLNEIIMQLDQLGPFDFFNAIEAVTLTGLQIRLAQILGHISSEAELDAFRHCVISCILAKRLGQEKAETAGDIHEECNPNSAEEFARDELNNQIGRQLARETGSCFDGCRKTPLFTRPGSPISTPGRPRL